MGVWWVSSRETVSTLPFVSNLSPVSPAETEDGVQIWNLGWSGTPTGWTGPNLTLVSRNSGPRLSSLSISPRRKGDDSVVFGTGRRFVLSWSGDYFSLSSRLSPCLECAVRKGLAPLHFRLQEWGYPVPPPAVSPPLSRGILRTGHLIFRPGDFVLRCDYLLSLPTVIRFTYLSSST